MRNSDDIEIRFAPVQLQGPVDYLAWRRETRAASALADDAAFTRTLWGRPGLGTQAFASLIEDARDAVARLVSKVAREGIDTVDPMLWLALAEAVSASFRATLVPDADLAPGASPKDLAVATAVVMDCALRAADPAVRATAPVPPTRREQMARVAQPYVDMVSGRAGSWVVACRLEAAVAARARHVALDASVRDRAWDRLAPESRTLLLMAAVGEGRAWERHGGVQAEPDWSRMLRPDCCRVAGDAIATEIQVLSRTEDPGTRGWCRTFSIGPVGLVAQLPTDVESMLSQRMHESR